MLWLSTGDPYSLSNQQSVDDSYNLLESNAADLISAAARRVLSISKAPETFAEINTAISLHLTQLESDLARQMSKVNRTAPRTALEGKQIEEFRRRMERLLDAYRVAFTGEDKPETAPLDNIKVITPDLISNVGRKTKYKWVETACIIFREIYLGDFKPLIQRDIELRMVELLTTKESMPDLETVRPTAGKVYKAIKTDPQEEN